MRNMIIAVLAVALSSGVAAADHVVVRGGAVVRGPVVRGPVVHERVVVGGGPRYVYRSPRLLPPAIRVEHYRPLVGYTWSPGYYSWVGGDYMWINGHYLRERPGYRWRPAEWVVVGGVPTFHAGIWVGI
jgi:hypothetical protein